MTNPTTLNIAVVGLGFGEDFLPIYRDHPHVGDVGIVDPDVQRLTDIGDRYGVKHRYRDFDDVLTDQHWDAIHILAPVKFHADYAIRTMQAGKHCACAVPMATELDELEAILAVQAATGMTYMMMETTVYSREFRGLTALHESGDLGQLTLYDGIHVQNLDGYPHYWLGYPPMKYLTHALSPVLQLTGSVVQDVVAYGTGRLTNERRGGEYDNPFPTEVGLFRLSNTEAVADITMSFFQTARPYIEGFNVYGSKRSVEWPALDDDPMRMFELLPLDPEQSDTGLRGRRSSVGTLDFDDGETRLPKSLVKYLRPYQVPTPIGGTPTKVPAHGGSHPHLVHEFISSIMENRPPMIDTATSAAWTAPGICAHQSALQDGERITVPRY
ncbi:Gfo/Idh/MocA family protein [Arthrobacter castelli]|uniref:Gfo/Idh/MocA family protein n=1 Tax=Arthrobacter castelli TaxID=271431 RepID=UPI000406DFC6|nr:Gfo/Idh/MocA family oxidoreductase [Arthrobacter castelli]